MAKSMNQSDEELQAAFDASSTEDRERFLDLYAGWQVLPLAKRVSWTAAEEIAPNTWRMGYPNYSPEYEAMLASLEHLGVYAPHAWMDRKTEYSPNDPIAIAALPVPELARLIFRIRRAERFSDGTEAGFIESGAFDALLANVADRLR